MRAALLAVHVVAGTVALLLAAWLLVLDGWAGRAGAAYRVAVVVVGATAVVLAGPDSSLPAAVRAVLVVVAAATVWAVVTGRRRAVAGLPGARRRLDGSVVSLVTAVAVVSAPVPAWVAVGLAGTTLAEAAQGRRRRALRAAETARPSTARRAEPASR